ncbi:MAG: 30S ribosomal protein S8 [Melioribacteraceae bacterium]|nr:30S ribosomal protein S8 [Melioribacteraceae bacterium]MCF8354678.1 30S ribosomal protein S8 [Melioribacteraceae bacterium]MCF8393580.1 30S ribosomal protein S8 [Melioribacteraceae bacterium]MCF8419390.1 30S ribosomal protein S8 [Melioribacteraceae bacterium]
MSHTDPIADFLTRIRNAVGAKKKFVDIPSSNMKAGMAELLKQTKFIRDYNVIEDSKQNILRIHLQYLNGQSSITGIKKISTPGLRNYVNKDQLPRVLNGLGIAIISTSKGLMTDHQARKEQVGGEVVCHIW